MNNIYIPITEPCLSGVADLLIKNHCRSGNYDLSNVMVVLPGGRAGRRLLEIICEKLPHKKSIFSPPSFSTPGKFCELFIELEAKINIASDIDEIFAWISALHKEKDALETLLNRPVPENYNFLTLAQTLRQIYIELSGDLVSFEDVAATTSENPREYERWSALNRIFCSYIDILKSNNISDKGVAVNQAVQSTKSVDKSIFPGYIYVVGVVDMFGRFRAALNYLSDKVTIISHGEKDWFEPNGGLKQNISFDPLDELAEKIKFCGNYSEQAAETVNFLYGLNGKFSCREIIISAPDDDIRRPLKQFLDEAKAPHHDAIGNLFAQSEIGILLKSFTDYFNEKSVKTFLNLVCHPILQNYIFSNNNEFSAFTKRFQEFASRHVLELTDSDKFDETPELNEIIEKINKLMAPLYEVRGIKESVNIINEMLAEVYNNNLNLSRGIVPAFHHEAVLKWSRLSEKIINSDIKTDEKTCSANTIKFMCQLLESEKLAPESESETVDIIGWLELPLDDAPIVILTGMNEGIVPESKSSHVFLPDGLRKRLGLQNNSGRFNRDRYYLRTIISSAEEILVTAGKYSSKQDPLLPSRLLLDLSEKRQAKLIERFYSATLRETPDSRIEKAIEDNRPTLREMPVARLENKLPDDENIFFEDEVRELSVTRFKDFLECPYRFYLKQNKINPCNELTNEMPPWQFGNVVHEVLEKFGEKTAADSDNPDVIRSVLKKLLDKVIYEKFGKNPHAAVLIQKDSIIKRLNVFAEVQAERKNNNWKIIETEKKLEIELGKFMIKGKIDRIDEKLTQKCIIDYKTSASIKDVYSAHYNKKKNKWIDLQLPLYAFWWKKQNEDKIPETAYFILQKDTSKIKLLRHEWSKEEIMKAVEKAERIFGEINSPEKGTFKRTEDINNCKYCDYKKLCNRDFDVNY